MQGEQTSICAALNNPTLIIEFSPDGDPIRTESQLLVFEICRACRRLRELAGRSYCEQADAVHASLFKGCTRGNLVEQARQRIERSPHILLYRENSKAHYRLVSEASRSYLEYDCPYLGLRELVFPVFFEQRVIAVLFVGQLCLHERLAYIQQRQAELLDRHKGCFSAYCSEHAASPSDLLRELQSLQSERIANPQHVLDEDRYRALIATATAELDQFERKLADQMELKRARYVRAAVNGRISEFLAALPNEISRDSDALDALWSNVQQCLSGFLCDFPARCFIVFGSRECSQGQSSKLDVVAHGGDVPWELCPRHKCAVQFDLSRVPPGALRRNCTNDDYPQLFAGLSDAANALPKECTRIRVAPVPFLPNRTMIVLVVWYGENLFRGPDGQDRGDLDRSLWSFYSVVASSLSSLIAATAQGQLKDAFRVFGHEMGQQNAGLSGLLKRYVYDPAKLKHLDMDKAADIARNVRAYIEQLRILPEQAVAILSMPQVRKRRVLAYRFIYKWREMFGVELRNKDLEVIIETSERDGVLPPPVYVDPSLFEKLLYNLLGNAIKYSHRGTRLYVDCRRTDEGTRSPHTLTITDYGKQMPNDDRLFRLFERGERRGEGIGVGLFLAKRIAEAHGGSIEACSSKVSDYNVPLIAPYLESPLAAVEPQNAHQLRAAQSELKQSGDYEAIIACDHRGGPRYANPTPNALRAEIMRATWKVIFAVTFPAGGGDLS